MSTLSEQAPDSALGLVWKLVEVSGPTFFSIFSGFQPALLHAATLQARARGGLPANADVPLDSEPLTRAGLLPLALLGPTPRSLNVGLIGLIL